MTDLTMQRSPPQRPLDRGVASLTDVELVAVVLRTGVPGKTAMQLAETLIRPSDAGAVASGFDGIAGLLNATQAELAAAPGLSPTKVAEILCILELARRSLAQRLHDRAPFPSPGSVKQYMQLHLAHKDHEVFAVLFLDAQNRMIAMEEMFRGTLTQTSVYPREVVLRALHHKAAAVVFSHNHPSGSVVPSRADEALTQTLKSALALVDVRVLDHVIIGVGETLSMAERGLI